MLIGTCSSKVVYLMACSMVWCDSFLLVSSVISLNAELG